MIAGLPEPPEDCRVTNETNDALSVTCRSADENDETFEQKVCCMQTTSKMATASSAMGRKRMKLFSLHFAKHFALFRRRCPTFLREQR